MASSDSLTSDKKVTPLVEQAEMEVVVVNPDEILWEGEATRVVVPGFVQELSILPNHTPLYSQLLKGKVIVYGQDETQEGIEIDGGVIRVRDNKVSIVVGFETTLEVEGQH